MLRGQRFVRGPALAGGGEETDPGRGEPSGGARNGVLEPETPAGIGAWVCGGTTPGGLGMEIRGWGCRDLVLCVWDPWGAGVGEA